MMRIRDLREFPDWRARRRIPHSDRAIAASGRNLLSVRRKSDGNHFEGSTTRSMIFNGTNLLTGRYVPKYECSVVTTGYEGRSIGRERDRRDPTCMSFVFDDWLDHPILHCQRM